MMKYAARREHAKSSRHENDWRSLFERCLLVGIVSIPKVMQEELRDFSQVFVAEPRWCGTVFSFLAAMGTCAVASCTR